MAGWRAKFTSAPTEPLAAYNCHRPDFVVMDIQTSRLDGITPTSGSKPSIERPGVIIVRTVDSNGTHSCSKTKMGGNRTHMETQEIRPQTDRGDSSLRVLGGLTIQPILGLENQTSGSADIYVTRLTGKLSLETVHEFLCMMRSEPASYLVLDLSGVSFLDSAGVGALVGLFISRRNIGKRLALAALAQQGVAVLQVSGLIHLLPVYNSVDLAIRQFRM
jgi:anti-anti-sigma factor